MKRKDIEEIIDEVLSHHDTPLRLEVANAKPYYTKSRDYNYVVLMCVWDEAWRWGYKKEEVLQKIGGRTFYPSVELSKKRIYLEKKEFVGKVHGVKL
jgi:hypothetical protein